MPEKPCAGETRLRFSTAAPDALCFIRPQRRSGRPPGTLRVPRVRLSLYAKQDAVHADGVLLGAIVQNTYFAESLVPQRFAGLGKIGRNQRTL